MSGRSAAQPTEQPDDTLHGAVIAVPEAVRTELRRGVRSVLVDSAALHLVRERFDDQQAGSLRRYLEASQSANTLRAYRTDWIAWAAWCLAEGRQALPADALDVAVYLAAAADARRPNGEWAFSAGTLERKSAALAAVHAANGLPSPTRADVVRLTLRGIRRTRRTLPKRKRPVLLHTLDQLLAELPAPGWPTEPARRRDTLLLLVGFAGALRRSEIAGLCITDVRVDTDHASGEPLLLIHLPTTKTDPTGVNEQRVVLPAVSARTPVPSAPSPTGFACARPTSPITTCAPGSPPTRPPIPTSTAVTVSPAPPSPIRYFRCSPPSLATAAWPTTPCPAGPSPNS